jgi:hypothetical protein
MQPRMIRMGDIRDFIFLVHVKHLLCGDRSASLR